ncbi:TPA: nucleoside phosphorylase, partial [Aeromonas hydrophila]|nr:nucleoside phosphorylase [Aeromonas hydrophila]
PPEYPACADIRLQAALLAHLGASGQPHWHGLVRSHDSFYRDDEQEVCRYWHQRGVLGADMETAALLAVGRLRKVRVAAVLCNVVAFEQDVQTGVSDYAASEAAMMTGERLAIAAALHALTQ